MHRLIGLLALVPACFGGIDSDGTGAGAPDADTHMMDPVDTQMLRVASDVDELHQISRKPYPSTVGSFNINVFVSKKEHDFQKIQPESADSHVTMPAGTLIVRQVLDANGQVTKVTLMGKGPEGYDPTLGDWWFGVTDPSGVPLADDAGPQVGRLMQCHGCHIPRADNDYLFGVPAADQR